MVDGFLQACQRRQASKLAGEELTQLWLVCGMYKVLMVQGSMCSCHHRGRAMSCMIHR
jgi:hypothetical protein